MPDPTTEAPATVNPNDLRQLEINYLNRLLLNHSVWQEVYTPMAGIGQMRVAAADGAGDDDEIDMVTMPTAIEAMFQAFDERIEAEMPRPTRLEQRQYTDILEAVAEMRQIIILGDPGSGKTTTLWTIAADYAERAKADPARPLPVFVRLGELTATRTLHDHIAAQLSDDLRPHAAQLMADGRLVLLLDGLNELPATDKDARQQHMADLRALVGNCQKHDAVLAVTCRELDYTAALDLQLPERVVITPLDAIRIRAFVNRYIQQPPGKGDELFWQLAGEVAQNYWQSFVKDIGDDPRTFWLASEMPNKWGYSWTRSNWLRERQHPRSMLTLARNPYMLFMMTRVFTRRKRIPQNRGLLFQDFIDYLLLKREKLAEAVAITLRNRLAELGYKMQAQGEGTSFAQADALRYLGGEQSLYQAKSANILTGNDQVRFSHQLLQEYFAACRLDVEMKSGTPATRFWPAGEWWEPQGWEETAILLAGLYSDDCTPVLEWLRDANPDLTVRCVLESGAHTPDDTKTMLCDAWLPRLTDLAGDPRPHARAAVGRGLGVLRLDNRRGVGLDANGLPDFDWVSFPGGTFTIGGDDDAFQSLPRQTMQVAALRIARYPVTYAQFEAFVNDDGYTNRTYWTEAGWGWKSDTTHPTAYWNDDHWHINNHPVVGVTWYEAYAFTQWATAKLGYVIRLLTEHEWEAVARGTVGRIYPWGNEYISGYANIVETENDVGPYYLRRTTPVGMYPQGASLDTGVLDMAGNVWEWTLTDFNDGSNDPEKPEARRVLRGGSWDLGQFGARAAYRFGFSPNGRYNFVGFRAGVASPIL